MITGIEHIAIYAKDSNALSQWYCKNFDGKIVYDNGKGTYFVAFSDGSMLEFCTGSEGDNIPTGLEKPGIRHIALFTDNFDDAVERAKSAGVEILKEANVTDKGVGTMFFRDPEGNILHFISRIKPLY